MKITLPETNIAPENGLLDGGRLVSLWDGLFLGAMLVSVSVIAVNDVIIHSLLSVSAPDFVHQPLNTVDGINPAPPGVYETL